MSTGDPYQYETMSTDPAITRLKLNQLRFFPDIQVVAEKFVLAVDGQECSPFKPGQQQSHLWEGMVFRGIPKCHKIIKDIYLQEMRKKSNMLTKFMHKPALIKTIESIDLIMGMMGAGAGNASSHSHCDTVLWKTMGAQLRQYNLEDAADEHEQDGDIVNFMHLYLLYFLTAYPPVATWHHMKLPKMAPRISQLLRSPVPPNRRGPQTPLAWDGDARMPKGWPSNELQFNPEWFDRDTHLIFVAAEMIWAIPEKEAFDFNNISMMSSSAFMDALSAIKGSLMTDIDNVSILQNKILGGAMTVTLSLVQLAVRKYGSPEGGDDQQ